MQWKEANELIHSSAQLKSSSAPKIMPPIDEDINSSNEYESKEKIFWIKHKLSIITIIIITKINKNLVQLKL